MSQMVIWNKKLSLILSTMVGLIFLSGCLGYINEGPHKSSTRSMKVSSNLKKNGQPPPSKTVKTAPQVLKKNRPLLWDEGLQDLLIHSLEPLPFEKKHWVRMGNFRMANQGSRQALGRQIETDLLAYLRGIEGISSVGNILDVDKKRSTTVKTAEYLLSGLYKHEVNRLRITATLRELDSGRIISSSEVIILPESPVKKENEQSTPIKNKSLVEYDRVVEDLLFSEPQESSFEVDVWTDKPFYQIGEDVTFYFQSSQDAYLTLLDVGTSGDLRIIFPNRFHRENRIEAGRIYTIPSKGASFTIEADGPPGLERIKGIATTQPLTLVEGPSPSRFLSISRNHRSFQREIKRSLDQLKDRSWAEGSAEIYITEDEKPRRLPGRFRTIKPKKPDKPIDITGTAGLTEDNQENDPLDLSPKKPKKPIDTIGSAGAIPQQEIHHELE